MSVLGEQEPGVKITNESHWGKLAAGALAAGGLVGTFAFGKKFVTDAVINSDNLQTAGLLVGSVTGLAVGAMAASEKVSDRVSDRANVARVGIFGAAASGMLLISSFVVGEETDVNANKVVIEDEAGGNTVLENVDTTQQTTTEASRLAVCEIYAPILSGDGSPENIGSSVALQQWLAESYGYEGPIDGISGPLTGEAVDRFQAEAGLEVSDPWNLEACQASPFGDLDPSTPLTGGWQVGWDYYQSNIQS